MTPQQYVDGYIAKSGKFAIMYDKKIWTTSSAKSSSHSLGTACTTTEQRT